MVSIRKGKNGSVPHRTKLHSLHAAIACRGDVVILRFIEFKALDILRFKECKSFVILQIFGTLCILYFSVSKQQYGSQSLGFLICTDVNTRDCTLGLPEHWKSLRRKSTVGEKSLATSGSTSCVSSLQVSMRNQRSHTPIYCYHYTKQADSIKPEGEQGTDMVQLRSLPYKIRPCAPGSLQGYLKCRNNSK